MIRPSHQTAEEHERADQHHVDTHIYKIIEEKSFAIESFNKIPSVPSVEIEKIVSILFIRPSSEDIHQKSEPRTSYRTCNVARGDFVVKYQIWDHHPTQRAN